MNRPEIRVRICNPKPSFAPGDVLECECCIISGESSPLHAVETSVLWYTEGKGEEDLGVHFFDRRGSSEVRDHDLETTYRFKTKLPNSPLSYDGKLIKIHWVVRVRVFYERGKEIRRDHRFLLGPALLLDSAREAEKTGAAPERPEQRWGA
jgi:hypothetical protein